MNKYYLIRKDLYFAYLFHLCNPLHVVFNFAKRIVVLRKIFLPREHFSYEIYCSIIHDYVQGFFRDDKAQQLGHRSTSHPHSPRELSSKS